MGDLVNVDFDDVIGRLIIAKEDHYAEQTKKEESALFPVSVRTTGASRALQ